jgi:hypothetical protein
MDYKKLNKIKTSLDYLDQLQKNIFAMIRQLDLPIIFVIFITGINNWSEFIQTLEELYAIHNQNNNKYEDVEKPKNVDLVKVDPIMCA